MAPPVALAAISAASLVPLPRPAPAATSAALWAQRPALVFVVRRPGCPLCREQAQKIYAHRDLLAKFKVNVVAVVHEELGADEFHEKVWKGLPLYFDEAKAFYSCFTGGAVKKASLLGMLTPSALSNAWRARNVEGNLTGEGRILGGLLLVDKDGVKYEYPEKTFGDHAPMKDVLEACRAAAPAEFKDYDLGPHLSGAAAAAPADATSCGTDACTR